MQMTDRSRYRRADRCLQVYMPYVHPMRTLGVARTLRLDGHQLFLDSPGSNAGVRSAFVAETEARTRWGDNVYCYDNDDIYTNPPDIIINGWENLEVDVFRLHKILSMKQPIVLCGLSGNFQSAFTWEAYRGLICTDAPSRALARYHDVPAIRYFELFDSDEYPLLPWNCDHVLLPTFVNLFAQRFPLAAKFHEECTQILKSRFGTKVVSLVVDSVPNAEVRRLMQESAAMLHIKDQEGYGWSVLESLSSGRPIIYQTGLSRGMTFHDWIEDGTSGFPFTTPRDLVAVVERFVDNPDWVRRVQAASAAIFRDRYDGLDTAHDLNAFLQDLVRTEHARWRSTPCSPAERIRVKGYQPSLDPNIKQDWELVTGTRI